MAHISAPMKKLNNAYRAGLIVYPRVNQGYIDFTTFQFFPHPPIKEFDEHSKPMLFSEYPLDKNTALLYLNPKGLVSPSTVVGTYDFIDKTFTPDLKLKNEMDIKEKLERYERFLDKENIDPKRVMHHKKNPTSSYYYYNPIIIGFKVELKPEQKKKRDEKRKKVAWVLTKASNDNIKSRNDHRSWKNAIYHYANDYEDAIRAYQDYLKYMRIQRALKRAYHNHLKTSGGC